MKTLKLGLILGGLGLVVPAFFGGCTQPTTHCQLEHATYLPYAVKYTLTQGTGTCSKLTGDDVGFETYHPGSAATNTRQLDVTTVAIETTAIGGFADNAACFSAPDPVDPMTKMGSGYKPAGNFTDTNKAHTLYSLAMFATVLPDADDFCTLTPSSTAEQSAGDIPATTATNPAPSCAGVSTTCSAKVTDDCCTNPKDPSTCITSAQPASSVKYAWNNFKIFVTAASPGTQFEADMTYTTTDPTGTCTATYHAVGMWPTVDCTGQDSKGNPIADNTLCGQGDPNTYANASGINPDFDQSCQDLGYGFRCMVNKPVPSLLPGINEN